MIPPATTSAPAAPVTSAGRLGLSLAGGGFRASLFHLGVLRRLAEMDVLRRVEVLSTVSGGSIIGGLYVLLLKKHLERPETVREENGERFASLTREQYVAIIAELERILVGGVRKNLRTRLLMNPLGVLLVLLTGDSLGRRMARLYERHLLRAALTGDTTTKWWLPAWLWPGQIRMKDLVMQPGGLPVEGGVAAFNTRQRSRGGSVITSIMLNATSLNSGGRFHFSAVEFGDWYLGYFRESEFPLLLARKALLAQSDEELRAIASGGAPPDVPVPGSRDGDHPPETGSYAWVEGEAKRAAALILRRREHERTGRWSGADGEWDALFEVPEFPGGIEDAAFGLLRRAKLAAWYLRVGSERARPVLGNRTLSGHSRDLWSALATIDPDVEAHLTAAVVRDPWLLPLLADYLLELYWLRTAERVSSHVRKHWNEIRLGHAIGASACFPPVFPPFLVYGLYDDLHVPRLGLTDGGVYDNMGITALLDEGCTEIIASDTSGLFNMTPTAASGHAGLALRVPDLLMRALGGVQREGLRERRRVSRRLTELATASGATPTPLQQELAKFNATRALDSLVYFHIASTRVEPKDPADTQPVAATLPDRGLDPLDIAGLRTDLDAFGDVEVASLINHGYDLADRYVRRYAPELVPQHRSVPAEEPRPFTGTNTAPERVKLILRIGSARFFRALKLRSAVAWAFTLLGIVGVGALVWTQQWTLAGIAAAGGAVIGREIELVDRLGSVLRIGPAAQQPAVLVALVVLAAAAFVITVRRPPAKRSAHGRRMSLTRAAATARKWIRALSGNLLWPLLGLPAIVAAACSALATASYVFFHLPFMRAVRMDAADPPHDRNGRRRDGRGVDDGSASSPHGVPDPVRGDERVEVPAGGS